ncbi:MAG: cell envelope integrity protein TolA [Steroidobacterales bacterium]
MTERRSDRILSIVLSILIHAAIVGALLWGWWQYRQPTATPPSLAIDATVVHDAPPAPATPPPPAPTPPPEAPSPPPPPDQQAEQQAREERARAAEKRAAEEAEQQRQREQAERAAADKAAADKAAAEKAAAEKAAAERAAAEKAAAEKAAAEKATAEKAEAERKAQQLAQQRKAEQERAQREADLRSQLASEEHLNAVQSSPAKAEYLSLITARINRAWIRPPSARAGVKCSLHITQIPGGEITHVVVAGCNGDEALRQSVETAAYRASPLPAPPDPALFDPNIDVTFAPDE